MAFGRTTSNMDEEGSSIPMEIITLAIGKKERITGMAYIRIIRQPGMKEIGRMTLCMGTGRKRGLQCSMAADNSSLIIMLQLNMKENTSMVRRMEKESCIGAI